MTQTTQTTTERPTTTTTRPPLEEHKISTHIEQETMGENASITHVVTNYHDVAVTFNYDVYWMDARNGGSDFMEDANRTTLTLGPGESARVHVEYGGNVSIDWVRYEVHNLRYAS